MKPTFSILVFLALIVLLLGYSASFVPSLALLYCPDYMSKAALDAIWNDVNQPDLGFPDATQEQIDHQQLVLDRIASWARTQDLCVRNTYLDWVNDYQAEVDNEKYKLRSAFPKPPQPLIEGESTGQSPKAGAQ